jgi:hypothetical protein
MSRLSGLVGTKVTVPLEIEAATPSGVPDQGCRGFGVRLKRREVHSCVADGVSRSSAPAVSAPSARDRDPLGVPFASSRLSPGGGATSLVPSVRVILAPASSTLCTWPTRDRLFRLRLSQRNRRGEAKHCE